MGIAIKPRAGPIFSQHSYILRNVINTPKKLYPIGLVRGGGVLVTEGWRKLNSQKAELSKKQEGLR